MAPTLYTINNLTQSPTLNFTDEYELQEVSGGQSYKTNLASISEKISETLSSVFATSTHDHILVGSLTDAATISWDSAVIKYATVTITENRVVENPTKLVDGERYQLSVYQSSTVGNKTLTWGSVFKWSGGLSPTLSVTVSSHDIIDFVSDGTNLYGVPKLNFS